MAVDVFTVLQTKHGASVCPLVRQRGERHLGVEPSAQTDLKAVRYVVERALTESIWYQSIGPHHSNRCFHRKHASQPKRHAANSVQSLQGSG